jgi:hypothetical protein
MHWRPALPLGLLAAMLGLAANAQPAPQTAPQFSTTVESLTVTGAKTLPDDLPAIVAKFVQSHGAPSRIGQLSRWTVPICPKAEGLSDPFNAWVARRERQVAASVGAPVDRHANCKPNLLIVFTTKPQELLDNVRKHQPQMLGFHYAAQTKQLASFSHPFQAWYITGTAPEDGQVLMDTEFAGPPGGTAGSRLTSHLTSQFIGALVVMDSTQAIGHQIGAIADHVAMLSLARASQVSGCSELPSILDFLNPDCRSDIDVEAMTAYDTAYLKGLYSVSPIEYLAAQRSEIAGRMMRELAAP